MARDIFARMQSIPVNLGNGSHAVPLDQRTIKRICRNGNKRAVVSFENGLELHCAVMVSKEYGNVIYLSKANSKKLKIQAGKPVKFVIEADDSPYQFSMPEEFSEVLYTDPEANRIFHDLTPGNQRSLIYLVAQLKSSDKKIERALKIADRLKQGFHSVKDIMQK
jgi:uncharacterized protein YdeI (YjbR/CyaY-like superfamily)